MLIAVIGDYLSPEYQVLLEKVKSVKQDEAILDLSRHQKGSWNNMLKARFADIASAHEVIIGTDWHNDIDAKRDITHAQSLHKDCFVYLRSEGVFRPFPEYAERV